VTIRDFVHQVLAILDYTWWRFDWHFATLPRFALERAALQVRGSQLLLLHLAANRDGVSVAKAREIYEGAASKYPERYQSYSFDDWLGYLTALGYLRLRRNGRLRTTGLGHELIADMAYMPAHQVPF